MKIFFIILIWVVIIGAPKESAKMDTVKVSKQQVLPDRQQKMMQHMSKLDSILLIKTDTIETN